MIKNEAKEPDINDEYQQRLAKRLIIADLGIDITPENFLDRISTDLAKKKADKNIRSNEEVIKAPQKNIRLAGRVMIFRSHGKLSFAQLQDFEGRIQLALVKDITKIIALDEDKMPHHKFWEKMIDIGDYIGVEGELFKTNHGELTLLVKELTFLGKALRPLPEKFHGLSDEDQILRRRYLDTITNEDSRKRFKFRSDIIRTIRQFFWDNNFDEVETPILEYKATGAAAKPYFTHNNALDADLVLRISQELPHKKLIIGGFERIFEIGKAFRNEGIDPSHLPEHTHFEWYVAYWGYKQNMDFTERLIKHVLKKLNIDSTVPVKNKEGKVKKVDFATEWPRIDYVELIKKDSGINILETKDVEELKKAIKKNKIDITDMDKMGYATLVDYLYKKVSLPKIVGPAFLYNYPKALQPLARTNNNHPEMVNQFQLVINGWEIVKGYSELVDSVDQSARFKEQEKERAKGDEEAMEGDDEYILAMEHGMPPISGVGLGLDRFITILSQQDSLRDCVFFPLMRPKDENK
jgi:lysyl-tRNA synthetase class 2